jgi:hypothetical protein
MEILYGDTHGGCTTRKFASLGQIPAVSLLLFRRFTGSWDEWF